MYESLEDLLGGWRRIFIESCHRNIGRMNRHVVRVASAGLGPVTAIGSLGTGAVVFSLGATLLGGLAMLAGVAGLAFSGTALFVVFGRGGMPRIGILGWPVGCLLVAGAIRGGALDLARGRPVRWGGRAYVIEPERPVRA